MKILIDATPEEIVSLAKNALRGDGTHLDEEKVTRSLQKAIEETAEVQHGK